MSVPIIVYADTSVFGGVFDEQFADASSRFFDLVRAGRFQLMLSATVQAELSIAPHNIQDFLDDLLPLSQEIPVTQNALALRDAYLAAGIVGPSSSDDALHVALATVGRCSMIVSWNFKHIVHFQKIPLYNAINASNGYGHLNIYSPSEVIENEEESL